MQAIRTIQSVIGGKLSVSLPPDFQHTQVEVIILPCRQAEFSTQNVSPEDWKNDFLSISTWDQGEAVEVESWKIQEF